MRITKNTSISIGLAVALAGFIFWFGMSIGQAESRQDSHENLGMHAGTTEKLKEYIPRKEVESYLQGLDKRLESMEDIQLNIQETQKQILFQLK